MDASDQPSALSESNGLTPEQERTLADLDRRLDAIEAEQSRLGNVQAAPGSNLTIIPSPTGITISQRNAP